MKIAVSACLLAGCFLFFIAIGYKALAGFCLLVALAALIAHLAFASSAPRLH